MSKTYSVALAILLGIASLTASSAEAALFHFTGTLDSHNDVVQFSFSLASDAIGVRVWTDSYESGANFDPITALWTASGDLIDENDDDDSVNPGTQTLYDSGFTVPFLAAGNYIFTVTPYNNFANGTTLGEGFAYDGDAPIPITDWSGEGNWSVWFDGVDSVDGPSGSVPEPASLAIWGIGALGCAIAGYRRRKLAA